MRSTRPRRKPKIPLRAWLALALFPFVVGFSPPGGPGTYISAASGAGHFVARPSCSPPEVTDYRDYQVAVGHQWEAKGNLSPRLGLGVQGDFLFSESRACDSAGCDEGGSRVDYLESYSALGVFGTADWKYLGLRLGGHVHTGKFKTDSHGAGRDWMPVPLDGSVRLGPEWLYLSGELEAAAPMLSGGGPAVIGMGGRLFGVDLWGGAGTETFAGSNRLFQARISRDFGLLRIGLTGAYGNSEGDYSVEDPADPDRALSRHYSIPQYRAAAQLQYSLR